MLAGYLAEMIEVCTPTSENFVPVEKRVPARPPPARPIDMDEPPLPIVKKKRRRKGGVSKRCSAAKMDAVLNAVRQKSGMGSLEISFVTGIRLFSVKQAITWLLREKKIRYSPQCVEQDRRYKTYEALEERRQAA